MRKLATVGVVISLLLPQAAGAWNNAGHLTTATVAYLSLSPEARSRVDALLRQHPDFPLLARGLSQGAPDFGAVVFMRAAIWPDLIRNDRRFFDDTDPSAAETRLLPGFPDMKIHKPWHFIDLAFSTDGTPTTPPEAPNALTQIVEFRRSLGDPAIRENVQAYNLSWLLHMVGDVHQPLHGAARFSSRHRTGDRGGNLFLLASREKNLHSLWDGSLGTQDDPQVILGLARNLMREIQPDENEIGIPSDAAAESSVAEWVKESSTLAEYVVYTIGTETTSAPHPSPSTSYRALAGNIARNRVAVGGYRLGAILEDRLQGTQAAPVEPPPPAAQEPTLQLSPDLARVLTDYEAAWRSRDAAALAQLFAEDGFVLPNGEPPVRGRAAIQRHYTGSGGPLALRAFAGAAEGTVGYILGGFARQAGEPDLGKFTLTLRKGADGRWLIVSDMDSPNRRR